MQEIFVESLDKTGGENLWQEMVASTTDTETARMKNGAVLLQLDLNINGFICGGQEVGLQIYVLLSLKRVLCPKAWKIGCKSNRQSAKNVATENNKH